MTTSPSDVADQAAEAIRALNHMTMDADTLEYPSDVYDVVTNLKLLTERLPQLFGQLAHWLWTEQEAGRIGHDAGKDAAVTVAGVDAHLVEAQDAARTLYDALASAHNELTSLKAAER
jgi:hypothetical protein